MYIQMETLKEVERILMIVPTALRTPLTLTTLVWSARMATSAASTAALWNIPTE